MRDENAASRERFGQYIAELRARAGGDTVRSGIVHWSYLLPWRIGDFDGGEWRAVCDQPTWMQLYLEICNGQTRELGLPSIEEVRAVAAAHHARGETPIAVASFDYQTLKRTFVAHLLGVLQGSEPAAAGELTAERVLGEERRAFFASVLLADEWRDFGLLPYLHYGLDVRFIVPRALFLSNAADAPHDLQIDFDDGAGFRGVAFDEVVEVTYEHALPKRIRVRLASGRSLGAACHLTVQPHAAPPQSEKAWNLKGSALGKTYYGTAWIFWGEGHRGIEDPVIFADGFGDGATSLEGIWNLLNQLQMAEQIRKRGKDLIILGYQDKSAPIQGNALVAAHCILKTIEARIGKKPLTVAGGSMGALVTRYALLLLQRMHKDHETTRYLSYDGQHGHGASIPLSLQYLLYYLENESAAAKQQVHALNSPAAQQLLWWWLAGYGKEPTDQNVLKVQLRKEFEQMGGFPDGFPNRPLRRYGLANGTGNGRPNDLPNGVMAFDWSDVCVGARPRAVPEYAGKPQYIGEMWWGGRNRELYVRNVQALDSAPGGTSTSFGAAAEAAKTSGYGKTSVYYGSECFVPTVSALAMPTDDPYIDLVKFGLDKSPFHEVTWSSVNTGHCVVTPELSKWVLDRIAPLPGGDDSPGDVGLGDGVSG